MINDYAHYYCCICHEWWTVTDIMDVSTEPHTDPETGGDCHPHCCPECNERDSDE